MYRIFSSYQDYDSELTVEERNDGTYSIEIAERCSGIHSVSMTKEQFLAFVAELKTEEEKIILEYNTRTIQISTHEFRNRFPKRVAVGYGLKPIINGNAVEVYEITKEICLKLGISSDEFETRFGVPNV